MIFFKVYLNSKFPPLLLKSSMEVRIQTLFENHIFKSNGFLDRSLERNKLNDFFCNKFKCQIALTTTITSEKNSNLPSNGNLKYLRNTVTKVDFRPMILQIIIIDTAREGKRKILNFENDKKMFFVEILKIIFLCSPGDVR